MIAYILRGHIRMYCFYFVFTGGCGPKNGGLISWGTYKQQYTASSSLSAVFRLFLKVVQNVKFDRDKWPTPAGHAWQIPHHGKMRY